MTTIDLDWVVHAHKTPSIAAALRPKVDAIVTKAAMDIEAAAKGRAPVDTGTLKNSIQASRNGEADWTVRVGVDYGVYVEYGTTFNPAQPFLRPAVEGVRPVFVAALKGVLG